MPIHYATRRAHMDVMKVLTAHRADLTAVSGFGNSPIDLAMDLPSPAYVQLFIDSGAKLAADPQRGVQRISLAVKKRWIPIVNHMLDEVENDPELSRTLTRAAVDAAVSPGHEAVLIALADRGVPIENQTFVGVTRLFHACATGSELLAMRMLEAGFDPNETVQPSGWNCLHAAVLTPIPTLIEAIVEHGANVNAADGLGRTPLHLAAALGHANLIPLLVKLGADINARTHDGDTPLHLAASAAGEDTIRALVRAGASLETLNNQGMTPGDSANVYGRADIAEKFKLPLTPEPPLPPLPAGFDELVRAAALYRDNPDVEPALAAALQQGTPYIHVAIVAPSAEIVAQILDAEPQALVHRDAYGFQPLHHAAEIGDAETLALLLDRGADVNDAQNVAAWTPLHFAASAGRVSAAQALLKQGANPALTDHNGVSPADVAATWGHTQLEALLRDARPAP